MEKNRKIKKIIWILVAIAILLILIIGIIARVSFKGEKKKFKPPKKTERQLSHSGLQIEDIKIGQGKEAKVGDRVTIHYIGRIEDGRIFESSYQRKKPFTFTIGKKETILGLDIGVEGMREGGKRKIIIPPNLAYGEGGVRGQVPPNAVVIFEVELIKVE